MSNTKKDTVGTVYVLTNKAMPDMVKIGITQGNTDKRLAQLYSTGVPVPFVCEYAAEVADYAKVEKVLHSTFAEKRVNVKREFFHVDPNKVIDIIKLLEIKNITSQLVEELRESETIEDAAAEKAYKPKRPNLNFSQMGIPEESELISTEQEGRKAIVIGDRKVNFEGEDMFLTKATKLILGIKNDVAPSPYWTFNGRRLKEIYDETYLQEE